MIEYIFDPFQYNFMIRALVVSVLVGAMCPIIGAYVIARGRSFMGDALAHSVLPGMVVAFMLGFSPLMAAVPAGVGIAALMGFISRKTGVSEDTSVGIVFAGMFALGLTMLATAEGLTVNVEDLLLGQVLGVTTTDVYVSLGLAAMVIAALYAIHRIAVYATFDPVNAEVVGIPVNMVDYALLTLLALVIVIGIQGGRYRAGDGHAHHACCAGSPAGAPVRQRHDRRRGHRLFFRHRRTVFLLLHEHPVRPGDGAHCHRRVRPRCGVQAPHNLVPDRAAVFDAALTAWLWWARDGFR